MSIILAWRDDAEGTMNERFKAFPLNSVEKLPPQIGGNS